MATNIVGATGIDKVQDGIIVNADIDTVAASKLTGALPAISGASLTNLPADSTKLPLAGGTLTGDVHLLKTSGNSEFKVEASATDAYATVRVKNDAKDYSIQIRSDQGDAWIVRDETAGANRLAISSAGNVGIGQTSPSSANSVDRFLHIGNSSTAQCGIVLEDDEQKWEISHNGDIAFRRNTTAHFRVGTSLCQVNTTDLEVTAGNIRAVGYEAMTANTSQGIQHAKVGWANASNKVVATFNLGAHSAAAFTMWVTHSDWSNHSGGGRIVSGVMNSGYGSPGSIFTDHMSPNQFGDITFSIGTSSNTRTLLVSGGNGNGPNGVHIMMMACSPQSWTLAQS